MEDTDHDDVDHIRSCKRRAGDPEWDGERLHFLKIITTFKTYERFNQQRLRANVNFVDSLSPSHQKLLADYRRHLTEIEQCFTKNQDVFHLIVSEVSEMFENHDDVYSNNNMDKLPKVAPTVFDQDKLHAVLKQIYRDWSVEGEKERDSCYTVILEELERRYAQIKLTADVRVLLPGAGLGRLAHEVVRRGYVTEGNEFSLFMLFTSNYILNKCRGTFAHTIYPFIHQLTNHAHHEDQIRGVKFPDVDTSDIPANSRFSMTAGDFLDVYSTPENTGTWDVLITCFFIDCSHNIVEMIERVHACLRPGGCWINLGPLLYHFADIPGENSVEPPLDFVLDIIRKIGFNIEKQILDYPTQYAENKKSMLRYSYRSAFLVSIKTKEATEQ